MKSKIEIRVFAVEVAASMIGAGSPTKDVVSKAKEIEEYIVGEAKVPEIDADTTTTSKK